MSTVFVFSHRYACCRVRLLPAAFFLVSPSVGSASVIPHGEIKSKGQKEVRIADTLEPVLGSHRLVITEQAILKDYQNARNHDGVHDVTYCGMYQLSRLTRDRGALAHDDRLDALAIGVAFLKDNLEKNAQAGSDEAMLEFLEDHMADPKKGWGDMVTLELGGDMTIQWEDNDVGWGDSGNLMGW